MKDRREISKINFLWFTHGLCLNLVVLASSIGFFSLFSLVLNTCILLMDFLNQSLSLVLEFPYFVTWDMITEL